MTWLVGKVSALRDETATARTLALNVAGWPGHLAGQHVDVRVTSADGYSAAREYSIANAPSGDLVEITVQDLEDGEVSPYLTKVISVGDLLEVRGPVGGWFVWRPDQTEPVQLIAGGSGMVPLMAMLRTRAASASKAPFRLLYSVRAPDSLLYAAELEQRAARDDGFSVTYNYTRAAPEGSTLRPQRISADLVAAVTWQPTLNPTCYVCGPTGFVEAAANFLRSAGQAQGKIKTERFGPTGGGA